jgi:hypothetical protein
MSYVTAHYGLLIKTPDPIMERNSSNGRTRKILTKFRGARITKQFPDILVTTKHTYEIEHKYTYTCRNPLCGLDFGRQRKLDLTKIVCGQCKSQLAQIRPLPKTSSGKENSPNPFGMFVKQHFAAVKKENPSSSHKEIMMTLSKRYREQKDNKIKEETTDKDTCLIESEDEIEDIITSLGIIDLD